MKFDSSYRNSQRADYEQFAKFIGGQHVAREVSKTAPAMAYQPSECRSRPIAMVYCENQEWRNIYDIELGLINGTIFEELDLPLLKTRCSKGRSCRG